MLIAFSATNFKSIRDEVQLSMVAKPAFKELPQNQIYTGKKFKLLRSALVYGANASGKSNLFEAIQFINGLIWSTPDNQQVGTYFDNFRLDEKMDAKPIQLSFRFIGSDKLEYNYELRFLRSEVVFEGLYFKPKGQEALLYERQGSNLNFGDYFKNQAVIRNYVNRPENKQRLILLIAGQLGLDNVKIAFEFFSSAIFWNQSNWDISDIKNEKNLLSILYRTKSSIWFEFYTKLIKSLDFGIKNIEVEEIRDEISGKLQHFLTTFRPRQKVNGTSELVPFGLFNESVGTHSLLSLGVPIIDALLYGKLIIVDEIDRSLHPQLVDYLINLFHDPKINSKNAQLICTTHNILLMNTDRVRRDQIWIMEKDENGASNLFSLGEFGGLKKEMPLGKYYLSGRLGGTPVIDDLDFLKAFHEQS